MSRRPETKFTADMTSDAKRLVRGEHWRFARGLLRRRDGAHHKAWSVLTLAGEHPEAEIGCIRALMHRAKIVAVDQSFSAVDAAHRAGADVALKCDLRAFRKHEPTPGGGSAPLSQLPQQIAELAPFDVVNLDLCCDVTSAGSLIRHYSHAVAKKGVLMATFSYGRDVAELFEPGDFGAVPAPLGGRVRAAAKAAAGMGIVSVLAYPGNQMPMCACLWLRGQRKYQPRINSYGPGTDPKLLSEPESFERVGDNDLYAAAVMFDRVDPALLYGVPAERILHFRRKLAAEKAVATRRARQADAEREEESLDVQPKT